VSGEKTMTLKLQVWRQAGPKVKGEMKTYEAKNVSPHMSFLEMLDVVNEELTLKGEEPIAFDHDCREGICGMCSMVINGHPHGGHRGVTVCQLHMRNFKDGETIFIEPWRAKAFPVVKDLVVDRGAFDRIIASGGYVSVGTGGAPDANALPVAKLEADQSMDAAACIGCGACVAACKNGSAMLFVAAKVSHLRHLPQGQVEQSARARAMTMQMDHEGFGTCTNLSQCEAVCPKEIPVKVIAELNRDLIKGQFNR
jgi:succinate dehydrogenase / fumarate reductase iron-sulfur subunit